MLKKFLNEKAKAPEHPSATRRKFLTGAAAATTGAAITGFPMISVAQAPIVLKMQGAWGAKDIFNEMAQEYVTRVND
ncbi:MAG: twin-arginine translocation signal domain-containing protein, partial [Longimicrobiales bacterium]